MQALVYLTVRSFLNGLRRALTSGRRIIGLLFIAVYWIVFIIRPFDRGPDSDTLSKVIVPNTLPTGRIPGPWQLEPWVWLAFLTLSAVLSLGVLGYRGVYKPADVDVLFPTPVDPRVVLLFRMVRDYFVTLLMPLFIALLGWRGTVAGLEALSSNYPESSRHLFRAGMVGYILLILAWVSIGYAASLFVNRTDLSSRNNGRWIIAMVVAPVLVYITVATLALRQDLSWQTANELLTEPLWRFLFLPATAANAVTMAPLTGQWLPAAAGAVALLILIAAGIGIAMTQVQWMYDQAAARGFDSLTTRNLQQKGDMYGVLAEQARKGALKPGRVGRWVAARTVTGPRAIVWKEALLTIRGGSWQFLVFIPITVFLIGAVTFTARNGRRPEFAGGLFMLLSAIVMFMFTFSGAMMGFVELLKRVDVMKPLPFSATRTVFYEVVGKAAPSFGGMLIGAVVGVAILPRIWADALAAVVIMPTFSLVITAAILLVTLLFPDVEDPAQRSFRGFMTLLGTAIACSVGAGFLLLAYVMRWNPLVVAVPTIAVNLGIAFAIASVCGPLYASYNPSE